MLSVNSIWLLRRCSIAVGQLNELLMLSCLKFSITNWGARSSTKITVFLARGKLVWITGNANIASRIEAWKEIRVRSIRTDLILLLLLPICKAYDISSSDCSTAQPGRRLISFCQQVTYIVILPIIAPIFHGTIFIIGSRNRFMR